MKDMHDHKGKGVDRDLLLFNLNDDMVSNLWVMLMRMVVGAGIKAKSPDDILPFIMGSYEDCVSVDGFVSRYVEPMGEEADHIQIQTLTDTLKVNE